MLKHDESQWVITLTILLCTYAWMHHECICMRQGCPYYIIYENIYICTLPLRPRYTLTLTYERALLFSRL